MLNTTLSKGPAIIEAVPNGWEEIALATRRPASKRVREATAVIGRQLSRLRREKGITQVELAKRLGVTQAEVSWMEHGRVRMHAWVIAEIARLLGVSADLMLGLHPKNPGGEAVKNQRLIRRLRAIEELPKRDKQALYRIMDSVLAKSGDVGENRRRTIKEVA